MSKLRVYNLGSLQLKVSPFLHKEGELIQALNVEMDMIGAWKKRSGYDTFLGTPDNSQITTLFSWTQNDGTSLYLYRKSGSIIYYSTQGTGDWTVCGNGTVTEASHVGHQVLDDTMIIGDGTAATRHSTDGTSFTNTTAAPLAEHFAEFQGRIWAARGTAVSGTNTDMFYSTVGTATDWTTDSSSIRIPGPGRINSLFKASDRLIATKDSGLMFRYDGNSLVDLATDLGPSSAYSIGEVEGFRIFLNRKGFFGYGGLRPELLSNVVERQIYNAENEGIAGTVFDNAPGVVHKYDYLASVGTVTDDLTDKTIDDALMKYDYQHNEWVNWKFANRPYAFHSYKDIDGVEQLIFGDNGGQCYKMNSSTLTDNTTEIDAALEGVLHFRAPESDKEWKYIWAFTNPGAQAKIQVALGNTFTKQTKNWIDLKQTKDGVMEARFPAGSRSKLLHWKVYEASKTAKFHFYGFSVEATKIDRK